ncbi:MAG: universal stress protein [Solirubrobacterales bacterium]|nr:universal stress protein [Solirubrobacterales bacterium]
MSVGIIVSYDGTANDDDALALGKMLAGGDSKLALAYVRHASEFDPRREEIAQHDVERRLEQGASWLGNPDVPRHVVLSPSTGEGLAKLAERERASVIVFGSDYRTPPGRVEPGSSAQRLLDGGPVAVAVAPAGMRTRANGTIASIAVSASDADGAAGESAQALAALLGASVVSERREADLVVVGSQLSAPLGRVALSGAARSELDSVRSPVLIVPHGRPLLAAG